MNSYVSYSGWGLPTNMDADLFLQNLRDLSLEEGKAYIQEHIDELSDHVIISKLLEDEALRLLYSPFVSLKIAELLIFYGEYLENMPSHALGLKAKGDALVQIGHFQAAMESLDAAGDEFLYLEDEGNWARSRISWITACAWLGRTEEALQEANRAHDVFLRLGEYYWVCVIDNNAAVIYDHIGRYQDELKLYENMLAIFPTLTDQSETQIKRSIAIAQLNQAICLSWLGKFEQAYQVQKQALVTFISLEEISLTVYLEVDMANLDYTQGYYGSALRRYYQALDTLIQNNVDNPMLLAELRLWLANCLTKLNRAQEACQLVDEAVKSYRQLGTSLQASNALREYATILVALGRLKEALITLDEASTLFKSGGFDHHAFATDLQQAELLLEMGLIVEAYDKARLVRDYFNVQGFVARSVRASLVMVGALIRKAQQAEVHQEEMNIFLQEAESLCKQTVFEARHLNLQDEVYKSQYLLGQLAAFQKKPLEAARYYNAAIDQIQLILDDLVYDLSPSFLQTAWSLYEDMIALCLQQNEIERAFGYLEQARSMALRQYLNKLRSSQEEMGEQHGADSLSISRLNSAEVLRTQYELRDWQERYHKYTVLLGDIDLSVSPTVNREIIRDEIKRCEGKISELFERLHLYQFHTPEKLYKSGSKTRENSIRTTTRLQERDTQLLRQSLKSNQLLLEYFQYKGKLVIFAATTSQMITYENPNGVEQLEHILPLLHAHLDPNGWPNYQNPPQEAICRLLSKLYDLLVAPVASLLPSRSGYLTIIPFGLLHKLPFHALYNGSHFLIEDFQINYLPAGNLLLLLNTNRKEQDVLLKNSEMSTGLPLVFGYSDNGHLKRALDEARIVGKMLNGNCYLEDEATIARLIEQAPGSPIIHLATHGQSRLDAPNFSYVRLADGQLNAIDAISLNLKKCELVTLSGCETGLALSGGGDEQLGLSRAFLAAGATSLVISLWPVEDNSTNELMQCFYQRLLKGESKVQALRAAQCQLLHNTSSGFTHPYFWAAFRLVGEVGSFKSLRIKDRALAFTTQDRKKSSLNV
jgi:CHAT domain-containing protein